MTASILEVEEYAFSPSAKTITFYVQDFTPGKLVSVVNLTRGSVIYRPELGGGYLGTFSGNVLSVQVDTTSMDAADAIQVIYDIESNYHKSEEMDFTTVLSSGIDTTQGTLVQSGTGMTIAQAAGNLTIACGTTANAETIIRSRVPFTREILAQFFALRSQAIINNYLSFQLVDVIGDSLVCTATSTTTATVTIPYSNPYYAKFAKILAAGSMAGQSMFIGACQSVSGAIPGQFVIADATLNTGVSVVLTFTVSGWTSGSTGTCTLYGWNYIHLYHNGATTTTAYFDCGRNGWASNLGDVGITITASTTGAGYAFQKNSNLVSLSQWAITSLAAPSALADRVSSVPREDIQMYFQIVARNGSTAPASTTTLTVGGVRVEESNALPTAIMATKGRDQVRSPLPVIPAGGTVSTVSTVTTVAAVSSSTPAPPTASFVTSAATTNSNVVKASSARVFHIHIENKGTVAAYVHFFNATSITVGTTVDVFSVTVAASSDKDIDFGALGQLFGTGVCYSITSGSNLYTDTTAVATAALVKVAISYV